MQNQMRSASFLWMVIAAISLVVVIGGGYWLFKGQGKEALPPAPSPTLPKMANLPSKKPEIHTSAQTHLRAGCTGARAGQTGPA